MNLKSFGMQFSMSRTRSSTLCSSSVKASTTTTRLCARSHPAAAAVLSRVGVAKQRSVRAAVFAVTGASETEQATKESPDTKAVKFLIASGVPRTSALEAYSKASQTAYWTNVTLSSNTFEVVEYLKSIGIGEQLPEVVGAHPNVLAYSVPTRLQPAIEYLQEIGVTDIATVIKERPSLLGLDPEEQLKRVVGYFKANDYTQEQIIELVSKNI